MRVRFKRNRRRRIGRWPAETASPEAVAGQVTYVGSPEHKDHPSAAGPPALRSDATRCEPEITADVQRNTQALRAGILHGCVGEIFEGGFPKYVWTWIDGNLYEARHINGPQGTYKGYRLERDEFPLDPDGRLVWEQP
jgi:hypothetical protein